MKKFLPLVLLFIFLNTSYAAGQNPPEHENYNTHSELKLSSDIKALLNQEMQQLKTAMESLVQSVAAAHWDEIAATGHQIKNSYILKKKLSEHQMHELHDALPPAFQEMDMKFHYYAGMTAQMARERDIEMVHFYIYRMNELCTTCHAKFATDKFPGFKQKSKHDQDQHSH